MRDRELPDAVIPPEASGAWSADHIAQPPWCSERVGQQVPIGRDRVPRSADAARPGEVGDRKPLKDEPEGVTAGQGREVRIHAGDREVGEGGQRRRHGRRGGGGRGGGGRGVREGIGLLLVFVTAAAHSAARDTNGSVPIWTSS